MKNLSAAEKVLLAKFIAFSVGKLGNLFLS